MGVLNDYPNAAAVNDALNKGVEANSAVGELKNDIGDSNIQFEIKDDVFINASGYTSADSTHCCTDYIDCTNGIRLLTYIGNSNARHAFYDENKSFISAESDYEHSGVLTELDIPSNAKYVRISCYKNQKGKLIVKSNPVCGLVFDNRINIANHKTSIEELNDTTSKISDYVDVHDVSFTDGIFINTSGGIGYDSGFSATDYIKIISGFDLQTYISGQACHAFYDENKNFISSGKTTSDVLESVEKPNNALYIRCSCYKNKKSMFRIIEKSLKDTVFMTNSDTNNVIDEVQNIKSANYSFGNVAYRDGIFITNISGTEGNFASDSNSCATDYVEVVPNSVIKLKNLFLTASRTVASYDRSKKCVGVFTTSSSNSTELIINIPDNVKYIRATGRVGVCPFFEYMNIVTNGDFDKIKKTNWYHNLYEQATLKPVISFIDDDTSSPDNVSQLKTFCDSVGIKISFACLTSNVLDVGYGDTFKNLLLGYEREGFPIITHGYVQNSSEGTIAERENDLVHAMQDLHKIGFTDYKACWVTPAGKYTDELKALAIKWGFESLIRYTVQTEDVENPFKSNPKQRYQLYRCGFESENDLANMKSMVDKAVVCNGWLNIGLHSGYASEKTEAFYSAFRELLEYAEEKGCVVRTLNEELRRRMPIFNNYEKY